MKQLNIPARLIITPLNDNETKIKSMCSVNVEMGGTLLRMNRNHQYFSSLALQVRFSMDDSIKKDTLNRVLNENISIF